MFELLFFGLLLLLLIHVGFGLHSEIIYDGTTSDQRALRRGMVIDAGSGGSRLHIYAWEAVSSLLLLSLYCTVPQKLQLHEPNCLQ